VSFLARAAVVWALVGLVASPALAQGSASSPPAPNRAGAPLSPGDAQAAPTPPSPPDRVAEGTLVIIEVAEPISTRTIKRGDMFKLTLAAPVKLGDRTVIAAGAPGMGQVVEAQPSGTLGRPAKLILAARYLEVDGTHVPLRAMQLGRAGTDETGVVLATSFVPYVGFLGAFIHGGEIEIPAGTPASAKLGADVPAAPAVAPAGASPSDPSTAQPTPQINQGDHP
jgi:hypothetical protein